jgi:streptomycin 6-kinase
MSTSAVSQYPLPNSPVHALPHNFVQNITNGFPTGAAWLAVLPTTLAEAAARWSLTLGDAVPNLSFNYVCTATRADGLPVMLKLGVPTAEFAQEITALRFYNGRSMVRMLEADAERGWILLERIYPGTPLSALKDDEVMTRILAETLQRLWIPLPPDHDFPPITDWANGFNELRARFDGGTGPLSPVLVACAEATFAQPCPTPVLLHTDFHHDNILATDSPDEPSGWIAIDPKGMAGNRLYDVGAIFYNPLDLSTAPNLKALTARRVAILAEMLAEPRHAIIDWGIAQCMLSTWWSLSVTEPGWEFAAEVAALLAEIEIEGK